MTAERIETNMLPSIYAVLAQPEAAGGGGQWHRQSMRSVTVAFAAYYDRSRSAHLLV